MRTANSCPLKAFDHLGPYRYFLTFCTFQRQRAFEAADRVLLVRTEFRRAALEYRFVLLAYCFMPDHVHLLVEGHAENSDGLQFIRSAKQYSGFHYQRTFGVRLWQRYDFERVVRNSEDSLSVARYILENPVRARLVTRVEEYPFLGSDVYSTATIIEAVELRRAWYL
jgi:putative transposase